jgi:hypothetical protein
MALRKTLTLSEVEGRTIDAQPNSTRADPAPPATW